jgi:hypothetical protein
MMLAICCHPSRRIFLSALLVVAVLSSHHALGAKVVHVVFSNHLVRADRTTVRTADPTPTTTQ